MDAMYNLQVMYELNALPLAYQITGLCGNVMVSRLNIMDYLRFVSQRKMIFFSKKVLFFPGLEKRSNLGQKGCFQ